MKKIRLIGFLRIIPLRQNTVYVFGVKCLLFQKKNFFCEQISQVIYHVKLDLSGEKWAFDPTNTVFDHKGIILPNDL